MNNINPDSLESAIQAKESKSDISNNQNQALKNSKNEFISMITHELRTPLNSIIGFSEALQAEFYGPLNKKQREYIDSVLRNSKSLLFLINNLLDFSKIETGKITIRTSSINLETFLSDALLLIREDCVKKFIKTQSQIDKNIGLIQADEQKLHQTIFNILSNAVKFSPAGGEITIGAHSENGNIIIFVKDTGIGIDDKNKDLIFEPFQQIDNSLSRKYEGSGLGLYLSKKFIELHGGKIWFKSEGHNKGSTFFISIPSKKG